MTHDELIAKAREHAAVFERGAPLPARVAEFTRTRVREAVLIYFGSDGRDDYRGFHYRQLFSALNQPTRRQPTLLIRGSVSVERVWPGVAALAVSCEVK